MTRIRKDIVRSALTGLLIWVLASACAAEEAAAPKFEILEYAIEGNTVLGAMAIETAVYPYLGPERTIEDVEQARAALEQVYQRAGFLTVIVNVPEQKVIGGVVRLEVVEGTVDRFRVTGNRYFSAGYIRERLSAIQPGEVPYFPDVQAQVAAFNRTPGRSVTPVLKAGLTPGSVEMEMKVTDQSPLHGSIELNNRQTINTEPLRLAGTVRYDNLWGRDHSISFLYLTSPQEWDQVRVFSANYAFRPSGSDSLIALYAVRSRSSVAAVGDLKVLGNANLYGVRAILPLRPAGAYSHSFILGVDYKDFLQDLRFDPVSGTQYPIDYTPVSAGYQFSKNGERGQTRGSLTITAGLRGPIMGNQDAEFENQRYGAHANFAYLRGDVSRLHALPRGYGLYARLAGQLSSQPLIPLEQMYIGGFDTVRGYLEAEAIGDDGGYGTLEVRTPSFLRGFEGPALELIGIAFVDAGAMTTREPLPGQPEHTSLASFGIGLRFRSEKHITAAMELGIPLKDAQQTRAGDPFMHMRLVYDF